MAAAIGIITIGGLLVVSGLKGVSITNLLAGAVGAQLNPAGGHKTFASSVTSPGGSSATDSGTAATTLVAGAGAKALVEHLVSIAQQAGGPGVYVASAYRPGSTVEGGGSSDHSGNDSKRAARDIAVKGVDAITGPPMPELDKAVVAIGRALGRSYKPGVTIIDTFHAQGLRIQIIWRTPLYGGHMGHIHCGARADG